jgi:hypothetical protein
MNRTIIVIIALCSLTSTTHAEFVMTIQQQGSNVVATGSGTLDFKWQSSPNRAA